MNMNSKNELLTTEQVAQRYNRSLRWVQDLMSKNQFLAHKVGREYRVWSRDVEHLVQQSRPRGRPRRLTASEDDLGIYVVDVADDVQKAQTEDAMEGVLHEYIDWLEGHKDIVLRLQPAAAPREVAFTNIEQSSRSLPSEQREAWGRVLQREVNRERKQRLADHLVDTYGLNVKVRAKTNTDWCVEMYALDDTENEHPLTIIYEAAVLTQTCEACGKEFSFQDMEMANMGGLSALPPLCGACTRAWNAMVDRQSTIATAQQFEQFKRERRT